MELSRFLSVARRFWVLPAALLAVGLSGVFAYQQFSGTATAEATVAVLDPLVANASAYGEAQVTFDAVIHSQQLAKRIAAKLGTTPADVSGKLSVSVLPALAGYNASPLFSVRATDRQPDRALAIADTAAEQARQLYIELNTPDPADVTQAFAGQQKSAQAKLDAAARSFLDFGKANKATDLPTRLAKERDLVGSLQIAVYQAEADGTAGVYGATRRAATLTQAMATEQAELDRLTGLEAQYYELNLNVQNAQLYVTQLDQATHGQLAGQALPFGGQVKILDHARLQSNRLWIVTTYSIGALFGLLIGATAIYLIGLVEMRPETADQVATAFRAPVLVQLPNVDAK